MNRSFAQAAFGIFEITGVGLVAMAAGIVTMLVLGPKLLPSRPDNNIADRHQLRDLTELTLSDDEAAKRPTVADLAFLKRDAVRLVAIRRGSELLREPGPDLRINRGDRLVVASSADELDGLARRQGVIVGLQNVGRPICLADDERAYDVRLTGLTIAPSHPALGRELRDIPFLSNLPDGSAGSRTEVEALARAWSISVGDLIASMPGGSCNHRVTVWIRLAQRIERSSRSRCLRPACAIWRRRSHMARKRRVWR